MPIVTVTRLVKFNAAHRVHNPALSDLENASLFGKCNNVHGHGHNYTLELSVRGPIDEMTGYVIDLARLKEMAERYVVNDTDHRHFNIDVPYMQGIIPTTENIVVAMWKILEPIVAPGKLRRLRLWETDNNYVEYEGEE
jgi:6-pyruvoyltetrahydropterin/6-carboxytetrahydropterin synthase